jgi:gamma-butyrobetaine dioxygenase
MNYRMEAEGKRLRLEWSDGATCIYPALWLRDNAPETRDPRNGQRLHDIADLPPDPRIVSCRLEEPDRLILTWADTARETAFDLAWLSRYAPNETPPSRPFTIELWTAEKAADQTWEDYGRFVADEEGRLDWMHALVTRGIAYLRGVPAREGEIREVARWLGTVRETNYGTVFDVRTVPDPKNLAYTDLGLGLHTDNPYRDPVPGFQMLHCLRASSEGGESLFADGFALAEHLRVCSPEAFDILTQTPVRFAYRDSEVELEAERPLIALNCHGKVEAIAYNNRSIAPLCLPLETIEAFYAAYRAWAELLRDPRFTCPIKLAAGDLVVFDNQRILHGRTAFRGGQEARHLQGCYLDKDGVHGRVLRLWTRRKEKRPKLEQANVNQSAN